MTYSDQHGYYFEELRVGLSATVKKAFSFEDVVKFSEASGDDNPLHLSSDFAAETRFRRPIIHGMLTTSLWSTIVGTILPGPGCAYMNQSLNFYKPVYPNELVVAQMTIVELIAEKQHAYLHATAHVNRVLVADGQARVWVPHR